MLDGFAFYVFFFFSPRVNKYNFHNDIIYRRNIKLQKASESLNT